MKKVQNHFILVTTFLIIAFLGIRQKSELEMQRVRQLWQLAADYGINMVVRF